MITRYRAENTPEKQKIKNMYRVLRSDTKSWIYYDVYGRLVNMNNELTVIPIITHDNTVMCDSISRLFNLLLRSTKGIYTGMNDVSGIKIFTEDILMSDTGQKVVVKNDGGVFKGVLLDSYKHSYRFINLENKSWKIIGNIFQTTI